MASSNDEINLTGNQLAEVFSEWHDRVLKNPDKFQEVLGKDIPNLGFWMSKYFIEIHNELHGKDK